jgi:hypothetical protein
VSLDELEELLPIKSTCDRKHRTLGLCMPLMKLDAIAVADRFDPRGDSQRGATERVCKAGAFEFDETFLSWIVFDSCKFQ